MSDVNKQSKPIFIPGQRLAGLPSLILTFGILLTVIWTATYSINKSEEEAAIDAVAFRSERLVEFFESHTSTTLQYADDYIKAVRRIYQREGSLAAVRQYMAQLPPSNAILSHITIMDAKGVPVLISTGASERRIKPGIHARDRTYFKFQKSAGDDLGFVSPARKGRNTGLLTVRLVRRITNTAGQFDGVLFAAVKAPKLLSFFETMRLGKNSTATLVGLDQHIILRKSQKGYEGIGEKVTGSKLWVNLAESEAGSYRQTSIVDGVSRLWTYRKLDKYPLVAVIGSAQSDTLSELGDVRRFRYAVALLISVIGIVSVFLIRRAIVNARLEADIEERKQVEVLLRQAKEDAERASAAKSEFLAVASHELRTPLTSIKGSLSLIVGGAFGALPENLSEVLSIAHRNTNRLISLVNDILDTEKIASGSMEYHFETLNLSRMVVDAVDANQSFAEQYGVTFTINQIAPSIYVKGDTDRLTQVIANLLSNAAKFSPTGGDVEISVTVQGQSARVSITDNGPGIPENLRAHIFDKFTQADSTDTRAKGGTGLGLNISKSIIESHNGSIDFTSTIGLGSEFFFVLPMQEQDEA